MNFACSNEGGPNFPIASLENPNPSFGKPTKFVSSLSFEFSSWKILTAYSPKGRSSNVTVARPFVILALTSRNASSPESYAEAEFSSATTSWPLSDLRSEIATSRRPSGDDSAAAALLARAMQTASPVAMARISRFRVTLAGLRRSVAYAG